MEHEAFLIIFFYLSVFTYPLLKIKEPKLGYKKNIISANLRIAKF